ncbi:hypothetical protein, partial [Microcoleus anatoxicus]
ESLRQELRVANRQLADQDKELLQLHERNGDLGLKVQMLEQELKEARRDRGENRNSVQAVAEFPEPADLLNQLKAQRKKSRTDLADIEVILELLSQADSLL